MSIKTNKQKAERIDKSIPENRNRQTISEKIHLWLKYLGVVGSAGSPKPVKYLWSGTQAEYDALDTVDDSTLYLIEEA